MSERNGINDCTECGAEALALHKNDCPVRIRHHKNHLEKWGDTFAQDTIICPHCFSQIDEIFEYIHGLSDYTDRTTDCPNCEKEFTFCYGVIYNFTSRKK